MRGAIFLAGLTIATAFILPSSIFENVPRVDSRTQVKPTTCNNQPIGPCTDTFFAHFGLKNEYNESVFEAAMTTYLVQHGVAGWADIKTWMQTLYTCVGGVDNLNACFQWDQLMAHYNMTKDMSQMWEVVMLQLEYETGVAYNAMTRHWYCIYDVETHDQADVQECKRRLHQEQHDHPNATCPQIAEYLYCLERPFTSKCGREAGGLVCHLFRVDYLVYFPQCQSQAAVHCPGAPGF